MAGVLVGAVVGGIAFLIALMAAGPGNGYDLPAVLLFPFNRLLPPFSEFRAPVLIGMTLLQFPVYGAAIGLAKSWRRGLAWVAAVHVMAAALALYVEGWVTF